MEEVEGEEDVTLPTNEENRENVDNPKVIVIYNEQLPPVPRPSIRKRILDDCSSEEDSSSTKRGRILEQESPNKENLEEAIFSNIEDDDSEKYENANFLEQYEESEFEDNYDDDKEEDTEIEVDEVESDGNFEDDCEYYKEKGNEKESYFEKSNDEDDYEYYKENDNDKESYFEKSNDEDDYEYYKENDNEEEGNFEKDNTEEVLSDGNFEDDNYDANYEGDCEENCEELDVDEQEGNENNYELFNKDNCEGHREEFVDDHCEGNGENVGESSKINDERSNIVPNEQKQDNQESPKYEYNHLFFVFKYLTLQERIRASLVAKEWYFNFTHPSLWRTLLMNNIKVFDWEAFVRTISARKTKRVVFRNMILPRKEESQIKLWDSFCDAIPSVSKDFLTSVDMGQCSAKAFVAMAQAAPRLKSIVSTSVTGETIDISPMNHNSMLRELVMKPLGEISINGLSSLSSLQNLISLVMIGILNLNEIAMYLPPSLVYLELGDCTSLSLESVSNFSKLVKLKRLRLVQGQNVTINNAIVDAISTLPKLYHLELINLDISTGFDQALAKCTNLKALLIVPTYFKKRATTSSVILSGVSKLKDNLNFFVWVVTVELLKICDMIIDEKENKLSEKPGYTPPDDMAPFEHIPILKEATCENGGNVVKIIDFPKLYILLKSALPKTRISVRRIPYKNTWSQVIFKRHVQKKLYLD